MRTFLIKTMNLLLIVGILFGYQTYAQKREKKVEVYEKELKLAEQAWKEAELSANQEEEKSGQEQSKYADGVYEGSGTGFGGEIVVQVKIENGDIASVDIVSASNETPDYLTAAEVLLEDVVQEQSTDVDTVSGATLSSNGILEGIDNALEQAE